MTAAPFPRGAPSCPTQRRRGPPTSITYHHDLPCIARASRVPGFPGSLGGPPSAHALIARNHRAIFISSPADTAATPSTHPRRGHGCTEDRWRVGAARRLAAVKIDIVCPPLAERALAPQSPGGQGNSANTDLFTPAAGVAVASRERSFTYLAESWPCPDMKGHAPHVEIVARPHGTLCVSAAS